MCADGGVLHSARSGVQTVDGHTMTRTSDISSFRCYHESLRERVNGVKEAGQPLCTTKGGATDEVVLSAKPFDELAERVECCG